MDVKGDRHEKVSRMKEVLEVVLRLEIITDT